MRVFFMQVFHRIFDFREERDRRRGFLKELPAAEGSLLPAVACENAKNLAAGNSKGEIKLGVFIFFTGDGKYRFRQCVKYDRFAVDQCPANVKNYWSIVKNYKNEGSKLCKFIENRITYVILY